MIRPRILVDCDGVLADFLLLYLELHEGLNGCAHTHEDVTDHDFTKCIATPEQDERVWRHIDKTPGLIRNLFPMEGALHGLGKLRELGDVVCVTSPHIGPTWVPERFRWLMDLAGFKKRDIVFRSDKKHEPGDVFIDDKLSHVIEWHQHQMNGQGIVFDNAGNRGEAPGSVQRARAWWEVVLLAREALCP